MQFSAWYSLLFFCRIARFFTKHVTYKEFILGAMFFRHVVVQLMIAYFLINVLNQIYITDIACIAQTAAIKVN